jgi:hypothetical protein
MTECERAGTLRRSVADLEALGLDWGTAVIATAQRYGVRLMDAIVASGRVDDNRRGRS